MAIKLNDKLDNEWNLYYYSDKNNNWNRDSFTKIYTCKTVIDFWRLYNNWNSLEGILNNKFFLMKNNTFPLWEDKVNINGGCWIYKIHESNAEQLWEDLSCYIVCEILCPDISNEIVGISISTKKNNICLIKIWNTISSHNSLNYINKKISEKWGLDVIYTTNLCGS